MRRAAGELLTVALLAAALLLCALWWRSTWRIDSLALFVWSEGRAQVLSSAHGGVCAALTNLSFGRERAWTVAYGFSDELPDIVDALDAARIRIYPPPDPAKIAAGGSAFGDGYLGFSFASSQSAVIRDLPKSKLVYAIVPHWAIALPLLGWGTWRLFGPSAQRRRRVRKGQCVNCGYDLRASEGRCPECGVPIENQGEAIATAA